VLRCGRSPASLVGLAGTASKATMPLRIQRSGVPWWCMPTRRHSTVNSSKNPAAEPCDLHGQLAHRLTQQCSLRAVYSAKASVLDCHEPRTINLRSPSWISQHNSAPLHAAPGPPFRLCDRSRRASRCTPSGRRRDCVLTRLICHPGPPGGCA
jgi:hypothetical protein